MGRVDPSIVIAQEVPLEGRSEILLTFRDDWEGRVKAVLKPAVTA
jgi:hypothetical protein